MPVRRAKLLAAIVGTLIGAQLGCQPNADRPPAPASAGDAPATVAPLFDHGIGFSDTELLRDRGLVESFFVTRPVFLPEAEARQIIADELAKYGVNLNARDVVHPEIVLQLARVRPVYEWTSDQESLHYFQESAPLVIDLEDPQRRIAVEYISGYDDLPVDRPVRSVEDAFSDPDLRGAARAAANAVARDGHGFYFGAFYDPVVFLPAADAPTFDDTGDGRAGQARTAGRAQDLAPNARRKSLGEREAIAKEHARQLLLQQVRDFANWLKAQGAI